MKLNLKSCKILCACFAFNQDYIHNETNIISLSYLETNKPWRNCLTKPFHPSCWNSPFLFTLWFFPFRSNEWMSPSYSRGIVSLPNYLDTNKSSNNCPLDLSILYVEIPPSFYSPCLSPLDLMGNWAPLTVE